MVWHLMIILLLGLMLLMKIIMAMQLLLLRNMMMKEIKQETSQCMKWLVPHREEMESIKIL